MPLLTAGDFASVLGIERLPDECRALVEQHNFAYSFATSEEHDRLVLETQRKLDARQFTVVGEHRRDVWQTGWGENLREFQASGFDASSLLPRYFNANPFLRFRQRYIRPADKRFELNFYTVLRTWLFRRYLTNTEHIYELGCGTGLNLILLAKLFPDKCLYGADWAPASVAIVHGLAKKYGWNLHGRQFDFFSPDEGFSLAPSSAVLTMDALEQIGERYGRLLDFLLARKPMLCIHVEPFLELYDDANLLDQLAIRYHRERKYLTGYLTTLRELERSRKAQVLLTQRTYFGGFYNESYSIVVWRPI